jgi:hypothetical protein
LSQELIMLTVSSSSSAFVRTLRSALASTALACALVGPLAVQTSSASAQFGGRADLDTALNPDFYSRDIQLFVESLGLEDWQRPILEAMLDDYKVSFDAGVAQVRDRMSEMKDKVSGSDPKELMKQILAPLETWSEQKRVLREEFLENVRSQLSEPQKERWPKFERAMRREKVLSRGELQGEMIDLIQVVRKQEFAPTVLQGLEAGLDEYEVRLDEVLVERQRKIESEQPKVKDAMAANNHQAGVSAMESIMASRVIVRDTQDQFREALKELISKVVGSTEAANFEMDALKAGYPKVYGIDPIVPLFDAARQTEGITDEQTKALDDLEAKYHPEIFEVNARLRDAFRTDEPREPRRRMELIAARAAGSETARNARGEPENIAAARKTREDVYDRYRKAIMEILNEEQQKAMPNYGKGERTTPEEFQRMREAKENNGHERGNAPTNSPLSANSPPDRSGESKKPRTGDAPTRVRTTQPDPRRNGGQQQEQPPSRAE